MKSAADRAYPKKLWLILERIENSFLVALLVVIIGMAVIQIFLRNLFGTGIIWADILVRILVLWIGMTGAMVGSRSGDHINIDIITRYLPEPMLIGVNAVVAWLTSGICGIVAYHSIKFVSGEFQYGGNAFANVPIWLCQTIIPLGFSVITLRYFLLGLHHLQSLKKTIS